MPANKVPSGNNTITEALEELLDIIVGGSEKEEHLLKQISGKLNKSTLGKVINDSLSVQIELLSTAANMLTAIAGYLYGEKGLDLNTSASQLLGKVKNNSPILGDKPMSSEVAEEGNKKSKANDFYMLLELKGITGQDLWALKETIDALKEILGSDELDDVDVMVDMADVLQQLIDALGKIKFGKVNTKFAEKVLEVGVVIDELQVINKKLVKGIPIFDLMEAYKDSIIGFPKIISELISGTNGKGGLVMIMNRINKAEENGLDPRILTDFFENVISLMEVLTKVGLFAVIAGAFGKQVTKAMTLLKDIVEELSGLKIDAVVKSNKNVENAAKLVKAMRDIFVGLALVGLFAIPAVVGLLIIFVASKLLFKVIQIIADGLKGIGKIDDITDNLKSIGIVVLTLGLLLVFAALTGGWVLQNAINILGFAIVLSGFIMLLMLPFAIFGKTLENTITSAQEMCLLIAVCALVMMLGAVFMLTGLWKESLQFGVVLAGFMIAVFIPFIILSKFMKNAIQNAKEMALLIVTCALVMMLGALFMKTGLWLKALGFAVVLTLFMIGVFIPFIILSKRMKHAIRNAKSMIYLIITCALVLMLGAVFMMSGLWLEALGFAAILSAFIFAVVFPFGKFGKGLRKAMPALLSLSLLVVVSTVVLLIGASYVRKYGAIDALIFAGLLVSFIGVIGGACYLLGKFSDTINKGLKPMLAVVGISALFSGVLILVSLALSQADPLELLAGVGVIAAIIVAVGGLSIAMGALSAIPFFWMGIGAVAAVAGIALVLSKALLNIGKAAKLIAEASNAGFDIDKSLSLINGMILIGKSVGEAGAELPLSLIKHTSYACLSMAVMISKIGNAVADISNLTVATAWDKNGNAIKYRQLNNKDFENAAKNTKEIITVLGKAIIELYNENPDMFKAPEFKESSGFFGLKKSVKQGKTPFEIVTRSCSTLGTMITLIAQGVADFADMKVATAWNADGKPTAYRHLTSKDFTQAAENISTIVTVLGNAVIKLYNDNEDLFKVPMITEKTGFLGLKTKVKEGKNPFDIVVRSCSALGSMITMIAQGVRDFAAMQIATKWDSNGNPVEYRKLTDTEIKQAIANIDTIITTLFNALGAVYNNPELKGVFDAKLEYVNGHLVSSVPIYKVISAGMLAGKMVSSLAQGVFDVANLRIATKWNKEGVAIEYKQMGDKEFTEYETNVQKIINSTFSAIYAVYKSNPKYFKTSLVGNVLKWDNDSPIQKVIQASQGAGAVISEIAKAVSDIANLRFKDENGKEVPIDFKQLLPDGDLQAVIENVLLCTMRGLISAYKKTPNGATDKMEWTRDTSKNVVMPAIDVVVELIKKLGENKNNFTNVSIPDFSTPINDIITKICTIHDKLSKNSDGLGLVKDTIDKTINPSIELIAKSFDELQKFNKTADVEIKIPAFANPIVSILEQLDIISEKTPKGLRTKQVINVIKNVLLESIDDICLLTTKIGAINVDTDNAAGVGIILNSIFKPFLTKRAVKPENIIAFSLILSEKNISGLNSILEMTKNISDEGVEKYSTFIEVISQSLINLGKSKLKTENIDTFIGSISSIGFYGNTFLKVFEKDTKKQVENYQTLLNGIIEPFNTIKITSIKKFEQTFSTKNVRNIDFLNKSINKLDGGKVDKFIELSQELRELSDSVGDIGGLVDALNGRINETLSKLSISLDDASNTIKASDKMQEKRQKLIEKNTKQLKDVMEKPMKLELSRAASNSIGSSSKSSSGSSRYNNGSSNDRGSVDTSTIETLLRQILKALTPQN